jgi:PAS domain S-box-containing protein
MKLNTLDKSLAEYERLRSIEAIDSHLIISETDAGGKITYANDKFCEISGYTREQLIGENHRILKSGVHSASFYKSIWKVISAGKIWNGEICNQKQNGDKYWVKSTIVPFVDSAGKPYKYVSYRTDITDIKERDNAHLNLLNSLGECVFAVDEQGECVFVNDAVEDALGYVKSEMVGAKVAELNICRTENNVALAQDCPINLSLSDHVGRRQEVWLTRKDTTRFPANVLIKPRFVGNTYVGLLVSFHDISRRKQAENELKTNAERFRRSQIAANIGTWDWNIENGDLYWSERIAPLFGYETGALETSYQNFIKHIHPDDKDILLNAIQLAIDEDIPYEVEHRIIRQDGTIHWVLEKGAVIRDDKGQAIKMLGTIMSIHKRKLAELELLESQQRLSIAIEGANEGVWDWDMQTNNVIYSDLYAQLLGYDKGELAPEFNTWIQSIHPDDWQTAKEDLRQCIEGEHQQYKSEFRLRCKNGQWKWVLSRGKVVSYDTDQLPQRMTGIITDIHQQKILEYELINAKQQAEAANQAKSDFLSSMSHELRTPLNAILGFAQLMKDDPFSPLNDSQQENVEHIYEGGKHLLELVNQVLDLSRVESGEFKVNFEYIDPNEIVNECLPILYNQAKKYDVTVEVKLEAVNKIYADYLRVKQVLLNLCSNAIKYNCPGGNVSIECFITDQHYKRILVRDSGIGIPIQKQQEIFTSFNRLGQENSDIEGTGVGLAITKNFVDSMNGEIGFESKEGQGSVFWFDMPLHAPS